MGAAYFIVLERKVDGLDTMMDGKSISRFSEELDALALQLGVRPLSEFISIDPKQAAKFLEGEGADADGIKLPPLQQFAAKGWSGYSSVTANPHSGKSAGDSKCRLGS